MPEDAKEAIGHGVRAKRSKSGAISFDLLEAEDSGATPSDTIGTIAAALAKAQAQLVNPLDLSIVIRILKDDFVWRPVNAGAVNHARSKLGLKTHLQTIMTP